MGQVERIAEAALALAAKRASAMTPDAAFTSADIAATVTADPTGETAFYVAQLIAWGIEWFLAFRKEPDLLEVFGGAA